MYQSTKVYDHNLGLSACYRQWRAQSHCRLLHGYALAFRFVFEAEKLDERNWVVDFGALKNLKYSLANFFDHKLLVAKDDPYLNTFTTLGALGIAEVVVLNNVGCEAFAELGYQFAYQLIEDARVRVVSCEVSEHGANSAIYLGAV